MGVRSLCNCVRNALARIIFTAELNSWLLCLPESSEDSVPQLLTRVAELHASSLLWILLLFFVGFVRSSFSGFSPPGQWAKISRSVKRFPSFSGILSSFAKSKSSQHSSSFSTMSSSWASTFSATSLRQPSAAKAVPGGIKVAKSSCSLPSFLVLPLRLFGFAFSADFLASPLAFAFSGEAFAFGLTPSELSLADALADLGEETRLLALPDGEVLPLTRSLGPKTLLAIPAQVDAQLCSCTWPPCQANRHRRFP
mmetsp:Transcript_120442/g.286155  ORF Transcript_120442/g.286155 Transcript_120442/m.286155 type:complete len:254 (+) Transcript_120442:2414-3175(+)